MFGENPIQDSTRFLRAFCTDQVARIAPRLYVRLTGQTGRGSEEETSRQIADYFRHCFAEYFQKLGVPDRDLAAYLGGKTLLEYGPGDVPGVALLMYAHGAEHVYCVDRFPLVTLSSSNRQVLTDLAEGLAATPRDRAFEWLHALDDTGLASGPIQYLVRRNGLSGLDKSVDMVYSRAVLEHVNDLDATIRDMYDALQPGGTAVHQIDLKSHGLHRANQLDFLTWPKPLWELMYGHKGVPNRLRVNEYRSAVDVVGLRTQLLEPTMLAGQVEIDEVRPHLARAFRAVSDADLAWLGFWIVLSKASVSE